LKKFLIALLAALLVVSMATVAFATTAGNSGEDHSYNYDEGNKTLCDGVNHDWKDVVIAASCTTPEYTIHKCSKCGAEESNYRVEGKAALGHLWDENNVKVITEGNCQVPGTVEKTCLRCGEKKTFNTEAGHKWTEWAAVTKETCVEPGLYKRYCTVCKEIDSKEVAATGKHLFTDKYVKTRATCTDWGTYEAKCTMCGKYFEYLGDDTAATKDGTIVLKIAKRNHKMGPAAVIVAPTCQTNGQIKEFCLNTNSTELYEACHYEVTTTIPANTMAYNPAVKEVTNKYHKLEFVTEVAATANTEAIGYYKCTVPGCGYRSIQTVKYTGDPNAVAKTTKATGTTTTKPAAKPASSTNKKGVSIPKTNDTTSNLPYVLIAVAFVGLVALVASKKKVNG
jgi:LPXTG-motif cell wall-anchored protein